MRSLVIDNFKETRKTTIKLAQAIPADLYDSCVVYEIHHISHGVAVWMNGRMQDGKGRYEETSDKDQLIRLLRSSRSRLLSYWKAIDQAPVDERGFLDYVLYITSHEVHHRGRLLKHLEGRGVDVPFMPRCYPRFG